MSEQPPDISAESEDDVEVYEPQAGDKIFYPEQGLVLEITRIDDERGQRVYELQRRSKAGAVSHRIMSRDELKQELTEKEGEWEYLPAGESKAANTEPPSIEESEDIQSEPDSAEEPEQSESQGRKKKLKEKISQENFKFKGGEEVRVRSRHEKIEQIWKVNKSFEGKGGRVYVRIIYPSGKYPEKVIPEDVLEKWNPRVEPQNLDNISDNIEPPKNKDDRERHENKNSWADPRFILELKEKYKAKLAKQEGVAENRHDEVSEHFKTIVKTGIIEEAIGDRLKEWSGDRANRANWLAGDGSLGNERQPGFKPIDKWEAEPPSEEIKQQIAAMMDWPDNEVRRAAGTKDKEVSQEVKFRHGQEVRIIRGDGEIETGWKVEEPNAVLGGEPFVSISKNGKNERYIRLDILDEYQTRAAPGDANYNLELLKPYFLNGEYKGMVKIKTAEGIVEGQFQGYSSKNNGVYIGNTKGERLDGTVPVEEFLNWQNQKTEAQKQVEKTNEHEEKVKYYIGKKVAIEDEEGNLIPGYVALNYLKDEKLVKVLHEEGPEHKIPLDLFMQWQERHRYTEKNENVKKYFDKSVKVLLEDGRVIEGKFVGISTEGDSVYLDYKEGDEDKRIKVNTKQFEAWQTLKTDDELDAEENKDNTIPEEALWDRGDGNPPVKVKNLGHKFSNGKEEFLIQAGDEPPQWVDANEITLNNPGETEEGSEDTTEDLGVAPEDIREPKKRSKRVFETLGNAKKKAGFPARVMLGNKVVDYPGNVRKALQRAYAKAGAGTFNSLARWLDAADVQVKDENDEEGKREMLIKKYRRRIYTIAGIGVVIAADYFSQEPYGPRLFKPPDDPSNLVPPFLR
jgi:hypothetical protein